MDGRALDDLDQPHMAEVGENEEKTSELDQHAGRSSIRLEQAPRRAAGFPAAPGRRRAPGRRSGRCAGPAPTSRKASAAPITPA